MRHVISPFRHALEIVLNLFGRGPRQSRFTPARHPESRQRFAQYVSRVQPAAEPAPADRAARLLGSNGSLSRGLVRHAPLGENPLSRMQAARLHLFAQPSGLAARRRAQAGSNAISLRTIFDALRVR